MEDDEAQSKALVKYLATNLLLEAEVEYTCVNTLQEGLKLSDNEGFHATIMDLEFPDSSADNTLLHIRKFPQPVIILTGHYSEEFVLKCTMAGAAYVFPKGEMSGLIMELLTALCQDLRNRKDFLIGNPS